MAHKGLHEFSGEEASNIFLGQTGFDVIDSTQAASGLGVEYWVAVKAIDGAAEFSALKHDEAPGSHLTVTGASGGGTITLADGDIVYGTFVNINAYTSGVILAYRGR